MEKMWIKKKKDKEDDKVNNKFVPQDGADGSS